MVLNQVGFAHNLVDSSNMSSRNTTPTATPYRSVVVINSIEAADKHDDSPAQKRRQEASKSLVDSISWLAGSTRPDLAAACSFLLLNNHAPPKGHMKSALYVLHYIHSTCNSGISFTSCHFQDAHSYIHFPDSSDAEAYLQGHTASFSRPPMHYDGI